MRNLAGILLRAVPLLSLVCFGCIKVGDSGHPNPAGSYVLAADSSAAPANGTHVVPIVATMRSASGAPIADVAVVLRCSDANATLLQPGSSNADGTATGGISSAAAGTYHLTAVAMFGTSEVGFGNAVDVTFVAPATAQAPSLALQVSPAALPVGGQNVATLSVQARPRTGESVTHFARQTVTSTSSQPTDRFAAATGTLDANGTFVSTLGSTLAGTRVIVAEANHLVARHRRLSAGAHRQGAQPAGRGGAHRRGGRAGRP